MFWSPYYYFYHTPAMHSEKERNPGIRFRSRLYPLNRRSVSYTHLKVDFKTTPYDIRAALAPDIIKRYRQVWRLFSRYARWQQLDVSIRIGWSDSFLTGLGSGVIWAAGSNLFAVIDRHLGFEDGCPRLRIYPDFAGRGFKLNLDASFSIRPVFLLRILVDTAKILIKIIGKQKEVTADYG